MSQAEEQMRERRRFVRRLALLNCAFVRNLAFHRCGYFSGDGRGCLKDATEMGKTINGNFIDIAVLEWSKVFAEWNGHHHWRKIMRNDRERTAFRRNLLSALRIGEAEWNRFIGQVKTYRDEFVAHLDEGEIAHIPDMELAFASAVFFHRYLHLQSPHGTFESTHGLDIPNYLEAYYEACRREADTYNATYAGRGTVFATRPHLEH